MNKDYFKPALNKQGWILTAVSLLTLLVLVAGLYRDTGAYLVAVWNQWKLGDYGHGYLVLAISAYLVFQRRGELLSRTPCPSVAALLPLGVFSLVWLVGTLTDVQILQSAALFGLVVCIVWSLLGSPATKVIIFPLAFTFLALPIWSVISPLLQDVTADAVFFLTRFADIPALREENFIVLPAGKLAIEEACSGLRFVLAASTLGALFAYLNYSRTTTRIVLFAIAVAGAILMNIVRVYIVVILAYRTDMQHPLVSDHLTLGWYLFAGLIVMLLFFEYLAQRFGILQPEGSGTSNIRNSQNVQYRCGNKGGRRLLVTAMVALLAAAGPLLVRHYQTGHSPTSITVSPTFPVARGNWEGPNLTGDAWQPVYPGAVGEKRMYRSGDQDVYLYLATYAIQTQGRELINELNKVSGSYGWQAEFVSKRPRELPGGKVLWQLLTSTEGKQRLVYYWYHVANTATVSSYMAKLLQLYGIFSGDTDATVVLLGIDVLNNNIDQARHTLDDFLLQNRPSLESLLDEVN